MSNDAQVRVGEGRDMDDRMTKTTELATLDNVRRELPPVLLGRATPAVERQIGSF